MLGIISQAAFCGKLSVILKEVMDKMVKMVSFIRSCSALQHRQFTEFLSECEYSYLSESAYSYLLQYSNVCWLSKGQVFERF